MKEKNLKDLLNQIERMIDKLEDKEERKAQKYELAIKSINEHEHQTTIIGTGRGVLEGLVQLIGDIVQDTEIPARVIRDIVNGCLDELEESEED